MSAHEDIGWLIASSAARIRFLRTQPHLLRNVEMPIPAPGDEVVYDFARRAGAARRCEGRVVRDDRREDTPEGGEGGEEKGAREVS